MSRVLLLCAMMALLCAGCVDSHSRAYTFDVEDNYWREAAVVEINNRDTTSLREISIFLKHQPYEALDSLSVRLYMVAPDSVTYSDNRSLAIERCRRGESVMAHLHTTPYRRDVVLRQVGIYKLYIFPSRPTRGIEGVGVSITEQ